MTSENIHKNLHNGLEQLQINLTDAQQALIIEYQKQLKLWNKAYNLTALTRDEDVLIKHILDSLTIYHTLPNGRLLDVGTGAGLPGLIIAISQPERPVVLLDSNGKKTRFLTQMVQELKLPNVTVVQGRIEDPQLQQQLGQFDVITSRAFASLTDFVNQTAPLLLPSGQLLAMKGHVPDAEVSDLTANWQVSVKPVVVPFLNEARNIIILAQKEVV